MTAQVLNSPASQYLGIHFLERKMQTSLPDDAESIEQLTTNKDQVWRECVIVLEWLGFIGVLFTYIILLAILVPKSPTIENYTF